MSSIDRLLEEGGLGSSAEVEVSSENPSIQDIIRAWCNEKSAPELLPFKAELVQGLQGDIAQQQQELDTPGGGSVPRDAFTQGLYQLDIDRIKFVLASYLRTRLGKVRGGAAEGRAGREAQGAEAGSAPLSGAAH
jgi:hypothetical protein